jgi:hypothetical protein
MALRIEVVITSGARLLLMDQPTALRPNQPKRPSIGRKNEFDASDRKLSKTNHEFITSEVREVMNSQKDFTRLRRAFEIRTAPERQSPE